MQSNLSGNPSNQNLPLQIYIVKDLKENIITKKIRTLFNDIMIFLLQKI